STPAEGMEGRRPTKENTRQTAASQMQSWGNALAGLQRVREVAKRDKRLRFTALLHHVSVVLLTNSFYALKREAAPGVDGVTWQGWDDEEEGELGAGCGHSGLLWVIFPPLDDYVSPASHRGSPDPPPDQEMAEGRRPRGRRMVGDGEGDSAGLGDFAAARECLPALRFRPLGPALAEAAGYGRGYRSPLCGRQCVRVPVSRG